VTDDELIARIEKVFGTVFGPRARFHRTLSRLDEPRWTSLKHVELIIALEAEFGVRFDGADATDMAGMASVIETVRERLP
jgi:acyl carrier protein